MDVINRTKSRWRFYNLVQNAYEIARDGDYATGTICVVHNKKDADLIVAALNAYEDKQ